MPRLPSWACDTTRHLGAILGATYEGAVVGLLDAVVAIGDCSDPLDPDAPIVLIGGGARGHAWQETVRRLSGRPVRVSTDTDLGARGAAAQAAGALLGPGPDRGPGRLDARRSRSSSMRSRSTNGCWRASARCATRSWTRSARSDDRTGTRPPLGSRVAPRQVRREVWHGSSFDGSTVGTGTGRPGAATRRLRPVAGHVGGRHVGRRAVPEHD